MGIKISLDWLVFTAITLILIFFIAFLVGIQDERNDVRSAPVYAGPTININTTSTDPILGLWVRQGGKSVEEDNITVGIYGYITKWEKINDNLTFVRGPWTKESENSYFIQWLAKVEWFNNYGVAHSFIPKNETISYDPSTDRINVSGDIYIRDNASMKNNSS